ncbi:SDR family oxidoreductase [Streptomyces sp. NPDC026672]|uniref:SDR family NAD(P)-dependent oxidoreductase n=1 Tax=unclassified Streptomyces TaxID=2593676 RepID=UPI0033C8A242
MGALEGKVALITGGSRGIGLAVARRFAAEGADVFITGRNKDTLDAAAATIGDKATPVTGDMSDLNDLDRLYARIRDQTGRLDVLVANAAVGESAPLADVTPEQFDATYNTDARGVFFTVQKALPLLSEDASVIMMSSGLWRKGQPGTSVYGGPKAALRSFARTWTSELKDRRIRVNVITVGGIDSGAWDRQAPTPEAAEAIKAEVARSTPLGRMGRSEELAAAALFLASSESSFVAGVELPVDGGYLAV